jgi:hypothetical protein
MKPSRRTFIAGAATLPIAASMKPEATISAAPDGIAAAPLPSPYAEYPWRWMVSHDDYSFCEDFETLQEALEFARSEGAEVVAECVMQDFSLDFDGDDVLEALLGRNEELIGEGEFIDATKEQRDDLGNMVTAAIEAWAVKHRISLTAWTFGGMRNKQRVDQDKQAITGR